MKSEKELTASPGLYPYWCKVEPSDELKVQIGQLFASVRRLAVLAEELSGAIRLRNVEASLQKLEAYVESYYIRAYEVRDRALGLLALLTQKEKDDLRHRRRRENALAELQAVESEVANSIKAVISLLDHDVHVRNVHTHRMYMRLGFWTGSTVFDPQDVLVAVDGRERFELERLLRAAIRRCGKDYIHKVSLLMEAARRLAIAVTRMSANDRNNATRHPL